MNRIDQFDDAVVVALGGNQQWSGADSRDVLEAALERFPSVGLRLVKRSGWWRSQAWPDPAEPPYLNGVALLQTELDPAAVMTILLDLERQFGRERGRPNAPRTLDLDLIAYGRLVLDTPRLVLPHPRARERLFVMGPLAEIAPRWRHPTLGVCAAELAQAASVGRDAAPVAQA